MTQPGHSSDTHSEMAQPIFDKVMKDFDNLRLTSCGKGDIPYIVTNPYQALAIMKSMVQRAEKHYVQSLTVVDNVLESKLPAVVV